MTAEEWLRSLSLSLSDSGSDSSSTWALAEKCRWPEQVAKTAPVGCNAAVETASSMGGGGPTR